MTDAPSSAPNDTSLEEDLLAKAGFTDVSKIDFSYLDRYDQSQLQARRIELTAKSKLGALVSALTDVELAELCAIHTRLRRATSGPPSKAKGASKAPPSAADTADIPF